MSGCSAPGLLRFFDRIRFYPVFGEELLDFRDSFLEGKAIAQAQHEIGRVDLSVVNAAGAGRNQAGEVGLETTRTASGYRLYALADASPPKPGLVFNGTGPGAIEVEIWEMDQDAFGSFVAAIPPPLGIGTVTLADGRTVKGFLCEAYATDGAEDITSFGGWRAWLSRSSGAAKRRASGNP